MESRPTLLQERDNLDFKITKGNQRKKKGALNPFSFTIKHHIHAVKLSYKRFRQATLPNLLTLFVVIIALTLPSTLYVLLNNVHGLDQNLGAGSQLTVYFKKDATKTQIEHLMQALNSQSDIKRVKYISPKEGLEQFANQSDLGDLLNSLGENPLPATLVIETAYTQGNEDLLLEWQENLAKLHFVESAQLDKQWIKRLEAMLILAKKISWIIGSLLAVGVVFIVSNTISLAIQRHKNEIIIYELVGATKNFIRRPFLYTGLFYGLAAGLIAWLLISIMAAWLNPNVVELGKLYASQWSITGLSFFKGILFIFLSSLLGLGGAWLGLLGK